MQEERRTCTSSATTTQRSATSSSNIPSPRALQHSTLTRTHFYPTFHSHAPSRITSARANRPRSTSRRPRNIPNKTLLPQSPKPIPLLTLILSSSRAVDLRTRQSTHVGDHERTRSVSERRNHPAGGSTRADHAKFTSAINFCQGVFTVYSLAG